MAPNIRGTVKRAANSIFYWLLATGYWLLSPARCWLLATGYWLLFLSASPASAQVSIAWKLKQGDVFFVETVHTVAATNKYEGRIETIEKVTTSLDHYEVLKRDDKEVVLECTCMKVHSENHVTGSLEAEYDRKRADVLNKADEGPDSKIQGTVLTITFDAALRAITRTRGYNDRIAKIGDQSPAMRALLAEYNDENLRFSSELLFTAFLPDGALATGAHWQRSANIPIGPLGSFKADGAWRYRNPNERRPAKEEIDVDWALTYELPKKGNGLPFQIESDNLKQSSASGKYIFDTAAGRLQTVERNLQVKGTLGVNVKDSKLEMPIEQKESWKIRFLDQLPASP